ncbi:cell wall anchor protein [Corynebacterium accolens]|uniref:cell wall anchor protein n=1 Tax=Corynebacterium accolens TaxID=38284 RepID=UPI00223B99CE|nr:cell wall anchor protein [Corynebacterium accolens]MCT1409585.1 cell wall anchor protein [Corynebacterium accolens]MDK4259158.1 cell wall anchor protein [Corynebacterium accolens]MDK4270649.1 cell wall anchor protein [Corynebacterium accolens]
MSDKKHAGAFDLRNVIGALLGLYGIILIACYFFLDPGVNQDTAMPKEAANNLWAGLAMLAVAALFVLWARLKPIRIPGED